MVMRASKTYNGSFGEVWVDGNLIMEIKSFELKVILDREDIGQAGTMDIDSKIIGAKGEGNIVVKKVYSRFTPELLENIKQGKDTRLSMMGKLDDPDSYGAEYVNVDNVWFNELAVMNFENNQVVENEFPIGFTPSDLSYSKVVSPQ